jgi:glycosyltransferase involved in cell wall biosynthesis
VTHPVPQAGPPASGAAPAALAATRDAPPPPPPPPPATPAAAPPAADPEPEAGAMVLDASDLIDFFRHNRAPTGIQRVQLGILGSLLEQAPDSLLAVFEPASGAWKRLPRATFDTLAALSRAGADPADPAWTGAMTAALAALLQAPGLRFPPGGALVNLGTSWWIPDYLRRVREAKAAAPGLRYIPFLHDCIPLIVPEHCAAGLVDEFARWFAGLCLHADHVLCNSSCTEADFHRLSAALLPPGAPRIPTGLVRLDARTPPAPGGALAEAALPQPLRGGRPYVLCVGTIESRKNHLMLFQAWLALLRRLGPEATPDLVCVGKPGWLAEAALALHANSPALRGAVHLLHGIADTVLEALLRGCLFTVQASHYEGWGLPVTESLAQGKLAVLPAHSGFLESGAGGAVFYTPGSEPELVAALERLIRDPAQRAAQEAALAGSVRLRGWAELAADVLAAAREASALPPPLRRVPARAGVVHAPRLLPGPEPSLAAAVAEALREGAAWSVPEPWGCWTLQGTARLGLPVEPGLAGPLRVHLLLAGPPSGAVRIGLRARQEGAAPAAFRMLEIGAGERVACSLDLVLDGPGATVLEIDCEAGVLLGGEGAVRDLRTVGAGLLAVMACRPDDLGARLDWLEAMALPRLVRL